MSRTIHILGAGLAGLSSAVHAKRLGLNVKLYEATPRAGGRIRSVEDKINDAVYDNGTHLIIEGYRHTFEYLKMIGATDELLAYQPSSYSFKEPSSNLSWDVPARHLVGQVLKGAVPGVGFSELWPLLKLPFTKPETALTTVLNNNKLSVSRFWEPFILSVFNTDVDEVSIKMLKQTLFELMKVGPNAFRPFFAKNTLDDCFIKPALRTLDIQYSKRLISLKENEGRIQELCFKNEVVRISDDDQVILALPAQSFNQIDSGLGKLEVAFSDIANIHFFLNKNLNEKFVCFIGTKSQWVYAKGNHICVTISNYQDLRDGKSSLFAQKIWYEIANTLGLDSSHTPNNRIIIEKHATPVQDATFVKYRPTTKTIFSNLFLCGDWIDTKLPATIESAIKSGKMATQAAFQS